MANGNYHGGPVVFPPNYRSLNKLITKEDVEKILNYVEPIGPGRTWLNIRNLEPYQRAFVHRSFQLCPDDALGYRPSGSNERSEFLGDKFLGAVVAYYLTRRYPEEQEGFLTKVLSRIVRGTMLHRLARFLGLGEYLLLAPLVERLTFVSQNKGRNSPRLYEDVFESLCGAIIEDFGDEDGYPIVKRFVISVIENQVDFADLILQNENHKDTLQRYFQRLRWPNPQYEDLYLVGPSHTRTFTAGVFIPIGQLRELEEHVQRNVTEYHQATLRSCSQAVKDAILRIARGKASITNVTLNQGSTIPEEPAKEAVLRSFVERFRVRPEVPRDVLDALENEMMRYLNEDAALEDDSSLEPDDKDTLSSGSSSLVSNDEGTPQFYLLGMGTANKKLEAQQLASRQGLANLEIDVNWNT